MPTPLKFRYVSQASRQYHWAGPNSILSELGTLHLEFTYLSDVTGRDSKHICHTPILLKAIHHSLFKQPTRDALCALVFSFVKDIFKKDTLERGRDFETDNV